MKYSIGHNRPMAVYAVIESPKVGKLLLNAKNSCIETNTLSISTKPKEVGYLLFNGFPCLFRNILFLVYVTLFALASKYGTNENVNMKDNKAKMGMKKAKKSINVALAVMPNQNIKFQKLSLEQRNLSQFIQLIRLKVTNFVVTWLGGSCQTLTALLMIFLLTMSGTVLADDNILKIIKKAENQYDIPSGLLSALAKVESDNKPYALNMAGRSVITDSLEKAKELAIQHLKKGCDNIDVGVMQINYHWHGKNFASITEMLIPQVNIAYAAELLASLYKQHGTWQKAVRFYHSATPQHHKKYSKKVLVTWLTAS